MERVKNISKVVIMEDTGDLEMSIPDFYCQYWLWMRLAGREGKKN
jgi:hypothetical protein